MQWGQSNERSFRIMSAACSSSSAVTSVGHTGASAGAMVLAVGKPKQQMKTAAASHHVACAMQQRCPACSLTHAWAQAPNAKLSAIAMRSSAST
jgi:hypothetical protein